MASLGDWIEDFHESSKKWDPLTHYALDLTHKSSTKAVNQTSDGLAQTADKWGWNSKFPRFWEEQSKKDEGDFGRWGENTIGSAAAIYGGGELAGMDWSALGGGSGGGGWASGLSSGDGAMLVNEGAGAGGGSSWLSALSGGLKGSGSSMSQNAQKNQSSYDRRTAELLAEILREQKDDDPPGFINPNAMPASQKTYA